MTGKERVLKTLRFEEPDQPPHFEIMFELEKEALCWGRAVDKTRREQ